MTSFLLIDFLIKSQVAAPPFHLISSYPELGSPA